MVKGESDLQKLLAGMSPALDPRRYVFATSKDRERCNHLSALMRFQEDEGETLILSEAIAQDIGIEHSSAYARITLGIHSALDAVGFLAAACSALAKEGISTNAVAAYHHDHIFVPVDHADDAMRILEALSNSAENG